MRRGARWARYFGTALAFAVLLPLPALATPSGCVPLFCATCTCNVQTRVCDCSQCTYYCLWW